MKEEKSEKTNNDIANKNNELKIKEAQLEKEEKDEENNNSEIEINQEQLEEINEEIVNSKVSKRRKNDKKYKKVMKNLIISFVIIIYFGLLILGNKNIPAIEFIRDLKTFSIAEAIITIIIFEVAYKKDNDELALHGIEMLAIASITVVLLNLYSNESSITNIFMAISIGVATIYYLIKSLIVAIRKKK